MNKRLRILGIIFLLMYLVACSHHKAYFEGEYFVLDGEKYIETTGVYEIDKKICNSEDGWIVYGIKNDSNREYIEISSWTDNYLYEKEKNYDKEKVISYISIGTASNEYYNADESIRLLDRILRYSYSSDIQDAIDIKQYDPNRICVFVKYNNEPVGHKIGYIVKKSKEYYFYHIDKKEFISISNSEAELLLSLCK